MEFTPDEKAIILEALDKLDIDTYDTLQMTTLTYEQRSRFESKESSIIDARCKIKK